MGKITRGIIMAQININLSIVIYRTLLITPDTLLGNFRCSNTTDTPVL